MAAVKGYLQISGMSTMTEDWQRTTEDLGVPSEYMKVSNPGKWAVMVEKIQLDNNRNGPIESQGTQTKQSLKMIKIFNLGVC